MNFEVENFCMLRSALDRFDDFLRQRNVCDESIFDSRLVLCELASNVLQHAGIPADITGEIINDKIEVEVRSCEKFIPPEKSTLPDCTAERGRGLYIVDTISERRFTTKEGGIRVIIKTKYNSSPKE